MSAELYSLAGRTAVVTGGLGLLGQQFTRALMASGARVVVLDARDAGGRRRAWILEHGPKGTVDEFRGPRHALRVPQQALGRHHDERRTAGHAHLAA